MDKRKILIVQPDNTSFGGIQRRCLLLSGPLESNKYKYTFMFTTEEKDGPVEKILKAEGQDYVKYFGYNRFKAVRSLKTLFYNLRWIFCLPFSLISCMRVIKKGGYDIVHVNGLLNFIPAVAARLLGKKVVWHLVGSGYPGPIVKIFRQIPLRVADKIVFVAKTMKEFYYGNLESEKFEVIYEPVDVQKIKGWPAGELSGYNITPDGSLVFGAVGNITPTKGYEYLLKIHAGILERKKVHLVIIGKVVDNYRDYYAQLQAMIREHKGQEEYVHFLGYQENVYGIMKNFDCLMMTSINEGTPISILEAMASRVPVFTTKVGGIGEQIIDNYNGFILPKGDRDAAVQKVLDAIEDKPLITTMVTNGEAHLMGHFSLDKCVEEHLKLYNQLNNQLA